MLDFFIALTIGFVLGLSVGAHTVIKYAEPKDLHRMRRKARS